MGIEETLPEGCRRCNPGYIPFPGPVDARHTAVLGLGNILLSDEGIGVHAVTQLGGRYEFSPSIDLIDGGTMGLDLLPLFQDRDRILIIDAVDFRMDPGYAAILEGDAIPAVLNTKLSVHHIGLADLLFAQKLTRKTPGQVFLVGVQPSSLEPGIGISAHIAGRLEDILDMAIRKLREWHIYCSVRKQQ